MQEIKIIYENEDLLVIDKPAGMVVHEGVGETGLTISDWLVKSYPVVLSYDWSDQSRVGVVHRLDKDTSGLLILAKNPQTQELLQKQFQNHEIQKTYLTLVLGPVSPEKGDIITKISRSHKDFRLKKTSIFNLDQSAKTAISHYQLTRNYHYHPRGGNGQVSILSLVAVSIITGKTHQIRAQMKYKGWPIIGDQQYNSKISRRVSDQLNLNRQFLHAHKLEFCYNGEELSLESNLPEELNKIFNKLT